MKFTKEQRAAFAREAIPVIERFMGDFEEVAVRHGAQSFWFALWVVELRDMVAKLQRVADGA